MYFCLTDSCVLQEAGKKYYKKNQLQIRNNKKTLTITTDNKTSLIEDHFSLFFFYLDFVSTIENARGKKYIYIYILLWRAAPSVENMDVLYKVLQIYHSILKCWFKKKKKSFLILLQYMFNSSTYFFGNSSFVCHM